MIKHAGLTAPTTRGQLHQGTPLLLGADVVVHSATKYLAGHSDVMAGVIAVRDEEIGRRIAFVQNTEGSGLAPFDAWLVLRGMKTMAIRMAVAQVPLYAHSWPYYE